MTAFKQKRERRVIPRWRDSLTTVATGELQPFQTQAVALVPEANVLEERLAAWAAHKTAGFASDLVGAALVVGRPSAAREAAEFLLAHPDQTSEAAKNVARIALGQEPASHPEFVGAQSVASIEAVRAEIRRLRSRLREDPRNALLWVDVARHYAVLGLEGQAARAMERGLFLTPNHRFTLRSAARLHLHLHDPERALALLRRGGASEHDPWLLAADLATVPIAGQEANPRTSRLVKTARSLIESGRVHPAHTTELASAVGTLALNQGDRGQARKMFTHALISPTENAVAQVKWAARKLPSFEVDPRHLQTPRSYEARAWECFQLGEWDRAIAESWKWLADEPFSRRPVELGTFTSLVPTERFDDAVEMARLGLVAHPEDPLLLNNLAVGLASAGRTEEALATYSRINLARIKEPSYAIARIATGGLIAFRSQDSQQGRALYLKAIEMAAGVELREAGAIAWAFLAREEQLARSRTAAETLAQAQTEARKSTLPALQAFLARLEIRNAFHVPSASR